MKLLIEKGADVNAQAGWYANALKAALIQGHGALAKLLIEKGADANRMALSDTPYQIVMTCQKVCKMMKKISRMLEPLNKN